MSTNYRDQKKKCQGYFCFLLPQLTGLEKCAKGVLPLLLRISL